MKGSSLSTRLLEARKSADRAENLIEAQRRIIASLIKAGVDTGEAEKTLAALEQAQDRRLAEIDRPSEAPKKNLLFKLTH